MLKFSIQIARVVPSAQLYPVRKNGFTLIELLVALAVLGMAAAMMVATLNSAWLALPQHRNANEDESVVAAQQILRGRLERLSAAIRLDSSEPIIDTQGDSRILSFAAPPLPRFGPGALQRYRLIVTPAGDLMLYTASSLDDRIDLRDRALIGWQPNRLLRGVQDVEISYFGPDRFSDSGRWQKFWIDRPQPPALIRIRLTFPQGDRRDWPELVVRPRATVNTACRIQRSSGRCDAI
ncbi:prepilin-type N-terminal cleavage/methylation domain-containing protein [Sphingorhabdus sp. IMCC26285]|jgi:general secretion pathway protein J|uniref:Prepilin-type N-terminal cleavage/methylation domain-containing protein n=1 Tax=Sphingorhabdus profundilacus TaxID=2509718 RepID=A0A6I4M284_9SPHN|nr:prepilin-type N-terminal cleavage/methylation domain-containing protein [Sphingorhabdus profundilacus]MVZ96588.1 prepilin-type N-terminal cleavage/methylation domain-containing protein [Sphingorhabdus profundilacus]